MSQRDGAEPGARAKGSWRTGRPSRWRATSDARVRELEGLPPDDEPGVIEGILRERAELMDVLFDDGDAE